MANARFEHSNFFTVNSGGNAARYNKVPPHPPPQRRSYIDIHFGVSVTNNTPKFDYERFNCNNFGIRLQSWNYRGCWHQTCPLLVPQ